MLLSTANYGNMGFKIFDSHARDYMAEGNLKVHVYCLKYHH